MKGIGFRGAVALWGAWAVLAALAFNGPASACASPVPTEGSWLAFPGGDALGLSGINIRGMAADGSGRVSISEGYGGEIVPEAFSTISWSADGAWLAFAGSKGLRNGIYQLRPDGSGAHFIRGTDGGKNPVFSPDGSKLAFARFNRKIVSSTTWVMDAGGGKAIRLTPRSKAVEYTPSSFSPDGSVLAVTRKALRSNSSRVLQFTLDGRPQVRVLARGASEAVFSPDGSKIALIRQAVAHHRKYRALVNKDLYVMSADGNSSEVVAPTRHLAEIHPSWDPSGERLAFNSYHISRDPLEELFNELLPYGNSIMEINADGSCKQKILSLKNGALGGPVWRPGQSRVAGRIVC